MPPRPRPHTLAARSLFPLLLAIPATRAQPIHVDDDAPPGGDGASWTAAFDSLQDALAASSPADTIHVAQGTYRPDQGQGLTPGDQALSFDLSARHVLGGFAGIGAPDPDARNPALHETTLSGDLAADDTPTFQNTDDNTHTIFRIQTIDPTTLDGLTITGAAGGDHGAIAYGNAITIRDCRFHHNSAARGGALSIAFSSVSEPSIVERCVFDSNRALWDGVPNSATGVGGAVYVETNGADFLDCRFTRNHALIGGAVGSLFDAANGLFNNCIFVANSVSHPSAWTAGGAVALIDHPDQTFLFQHCLFYANHAPDGTGGGVLLVNKPPELRNCILWNNTDNSGDSFQAQVHPFPAPIGSGAYTTLTNLIQNAPDLPPETPVALDLEPAFIDPAGPDGTLGTDDDDFRPAFGSPAIDAASPVLFAGDFPDVRGLTRPVDDPATPNVQYAAFTGLADIGPYEYQEDCDGNTIVDSLDITSGTHDDCDDNGVPDVCQTFHDCNDNALPDECEIASGALPDCNANSIPDACDIADGTSYDANFNTIPDECEPTTIFVDANAKSAPRTAQRGASWATPYASLQDALDAARARHAYTEIWVAEGTYTPAPPGGSIKRAFDLVPGVPLRGGFAGHETTPDQRIPDAHPTILSGDLDANDNHADETSFDDNALTVVRAPACTGLALDHVVIAHGHGRVRPGSATFVFGSGEEQGGHPRQPGDDVAALDIAGGSPLFRHTTIRDNRAVGSVIAHWGNARASLESARITANVLTGSGFPRVLSQYALFKAPLGVRPLALTPSPPPPPPSLTLTRCTIDRNAPAGPSDAIAIETHLTDITIEGSLLTANNDMASVLHAHLGGDQSGIPNDIDATARITNSAFVANDAAALTFEAYTFLLDSDNLFITSSTIAHNRAGIHLGLVFPDIVNSIIYANDEHQIFPGFQLASEYVITSHNTIQGFDPADNNGTTLIANIPDDPLFRDPIGPDGIPRTGDEDFRLIHASTSADSGDSTLLPPGAATDLAGAPRTADDNLAPDTGIPAAPGAPVVDRGAYETQPKPCPADLNDDDRTDIHDFAILLLNFGDAVPPGAMGDLNADATIDILDFAILAPDFGCGT